MRIIIFIIISTYFLNINHVWANNKSNAVNKTLFSIGEVLEFQSTILNEKRTVNIYLPQSYTKNTDQKYPVIYLLDGSADEDFIHIAGLVQYSSFSWINNIPETIVVGIANVDRKRDYTYSSNNKTDREQFPTNGNSTNFINFISKELQPLINNAYRTNSIKTLIGQSFGGLLATEILFKYPSLFDHYIIISPSLWWDDGSLLKMTAKTINSPKSIYIGVGKEGEIMENGAKSLHNKLNNVQTNNTNIYFKFFEKLDHTDTLHLAVYDAFEKIFKQK